MIEYIVFDGVDGNVVFCKTQEESVMALQNFIDESKGDYEWLDGIEKGVIARITHTVEQKEHTVQNDDAENYGAISYYDMEITPKVMSINQYFGAIHTSITESDRDKWKAMALELGEVVEVLKTGGAQYGCFCAMATGNPMYSSHSDKCKKALNALAKLKEMEE